MTDPVHPTITFQINLRSGSLFPSRYQTNQDQALADNNQLATKNTVGIPGVGFFKHGDKFTVSGVLAQRLFDNPTVAGGTLVVCNQDEDFNCVPDTDVGTLVGDTATATATMQAIDVLSVVSRGGSIAGADGYSVSSILTVSGGTNTDDAEIVVDSVSSVVGQTQTAFTGGENNGTFSSGSGHAALDVITMSDGTTVRADTVDVGESFGILTFTITGASTSGNANEDTVTQSGTTGSGTGFSITYDTYNQAVFAASVREVSEIKQGGNYSALPSNPVAATGSGPDNATFNLDWGVKEVTVTDGGSLYTSAPDVTFSGGSGTTAIATLVDAAVSSVVVTVPGSGYSAIASVTIDSP